MRFLIVTLLTLVLCACGPTSTAPPRDASPSEKDLGAEAPTDAAAEADAGLMEVPEADAGPLEDAGEVPRGPHWAPTTGVPPSAPLGRWGAVLVHDTREGRLILHGGSHYPNGDAADTWAFDLETRSWTELETTNPPSARFCHCASYLPETHELLIMNGRNDAGAVPRGAFTLDLSTQVWSAVDAEAPDGLVGCNTAYDPMRARVIVFGGSGPGALVATTWSYEPTTRRFTRLEPETRPPVRRDAMMVYDPLEDRVLLFGGQTGRTSHAQDLWSFDGDTWTELPVAEAPRGRRWGSSGIDEQGTWLIFGGTDERVSFADLWRFDPASRSFTQLELEDPPSGRAGAAHSFVPELDALVVFGGLDMEVFGALTDGWMLGYH